MSKSKIEKGQVVVFSDATGRLIVGEFVESYADGKTFKNPLIVQTDLVPDPQDPSNRAKARQKISFIPFAHMELFEAGADQVWLFDSASVCVSNTSEGTKTVFSEVNEKYRTYMERMEQEKAKAAAVAEEGKEIKLA